MCFGTAVHSAMEHLYTDLKNTNKLETKEQFINDFKAALHKEVLSDSDLNNYLEKGQKVLSAYYDFYEKSFINALFTEKSFGKSLTSQIFLDDIPLTGKADRIDVINKEDKYVRFVDYKTGHAKSRNEIEGLTKNSDGGYKRQLVFYQLLADLDRSFEYKVKETMLDFVESDKGTFHQEKFSITPEEVDKLKQLIRETMVSIRSFNFDRTSDYSHCVRCDFKSHCWPDGLPLAEKEED